MRGAILEAPKMKKPASDTLSTSPDILSKNHRALTSCHNPVYLYPSPRESGR